MSDVTPDLGLVLGSGEEGRQWVGRRALRESTMPISESMIRLYAALIEDGNPRFWDQGECPPGLLMCVAQRPPWQPGADADPRPWALAWDIPLPGRHFINVEADTEFERPLRVGDRVSVADEVVAVSEEKRTRLGPGHFVTIRSAYANQDQEQCAVQTNVFLRYDVESGGAASADAAPDPRAVDDALEDDELPPITLPVSYARVCQCAAATWDWFPGHHHPAYARSQGQRTIYVNTPFHQGLVDRLVTDWAGPEAFIRRRTVRMVRAICAGDTAVARGRITGRAKHDGRELVEVEAAIATAEGVCASAELVAEMPAPSRREDG